MTTKAERAISLSQEDIQIHKPENSFTGEERANLAQELIDLFKQASSNGAGFGRDANYFEPNGRQGSDRWRGIEIRRGRGMFQIYYDDEVSAHQKLNRRILLNLIKTSSFEQGMKSDEGEIVILCATVDQNDNPDGVISYLKWSDSNPSQNESHSGTPMAAKRIKGMIRSIKPRKVKPLLL